MRSQTLAYSIYFPLLRWCQLSRTRPMLQHLCYEQHTFVIGEGNVSQGTINSAEFAWYPAGQRLRAHLVDVLTRGRERAM
eukprot:3886287-Pleurochrysis_carterae.AAC.5